MKLENWALVSAKVSPYTAPECIEHYMSGEVYGNSLFADGTKIYTSAIVKVMGDSVMTYSGNVYELGEPSPEYEKEYPNAKKRLAAMVEGVK